MTTRFIIHLRHQCGCTFRMWFNMQNNLSPFIVFTLSRSTEADFIRLEKLTPETDESGGANAKWKLFFLFWGGSMSRFRIFHFARCVKIWNYFSISIISTYLFRKKNLGSHSCFVDVNTTRAMDEQPSEMSESEQYELKIGVFPNQISSYYGEVRAAQAPLSVLFQ